MRFHLYILGLIVLCFAPGCASGLVRGLVSAQTWSENYALLDGVTCTSPEMIDGNLETVGRSPHRIFITLPERRSIHRIVIRGTNIEDVIVYAGIGSGEDWKKEKQIKNNRQPTIDMRVTMATDKIRLVVGGTFDDQRQAGRYSPRYDAMVGRRVKRGTPIAQEIEIYGFADKPKPDLDSPAPPAEIEEETPEF